MAQTRISEAGYDITLNQLILLINIAENPNSTQVVLAESILKDYASVARMVEILVRKKYLNRVEDKDDRRKKKLTLSTKGEAMLATLIPIVKEYREIAKGDFTEDKLATLSKLLIQLTENCEDDINNGKSVIYPIRDSLDNVL